MIGMVNSRQSEKVTDEYLDELAFLAETAGAVTIKKFTQRLEHADSRTFVGKGKLQEIKSFCEGRAVQLVIFDDELTGSQIQNIERDLKIVTIDRTDLILDILRPGRRLLRQRCR